MNKLIHAIAFVMALALATAARADTIVVYDNGAPDHASGNNMGFALQAEDFIIPSGATLPIVDFWSLEAPGAFRGSISWQIRANAGGVPGALLSAAVGVPSRLLTGSALGLEEFRNRLQLDVSLASGSYWLVLHNGLLTENGDPNEFLWETTASNGTVRGRESFDLGLGFTTNFNEHAFQLSAVPEPHIASMLAAGLLILLFVRKPMRAASDLFK